MPQWGWHSGEGDLRPPEGCLILRTDPKSLGADPLLLAIGPQCISSGLCWKSRCG